MRVVALIDDQDAVRRILKRLGHGAPESAEPRPPAQTSDWPQNAVIHPSHYTVASRLSEFAPS